MLPVGPYIYFLLHRLKKALNNKLIINKHWSFKTNSIFTELQMRRNLCAVLDKLFQPLLKKRVSHVVLVEREIDGWEHKPLSYRNIWLQVIVSLSDIQLEHHMPSGVILSLTSAFFYAAYLVFLRRQVDHEDKMDIPLFFGMLSYI